MSAADAALASERRRVAVRRRRRDERRGPMGEGRALKMSAEIAAIMSVQRRADLAQAIGVECMGQEHANADEDEERRHDFGHSLPPCIVMPRRARLRNSR